MKEEILEFMEKKQDEQQKQVNREIQKKITKAEKKWFETKCDEVELRKQHKDR